MGLYQKIKDGARGVDLSASVKLFKNNRLCCVEKAAAVNFPKIWISIKINIGNGAPWAHI